MDRGIAGGHGQPGGSTDLLNFLDVTVLIISRTGFVAGLDTIIVLDQVCNLQ